MLRTNMQFIQGKVIHVTSSIAGEGKSTISANLAIALAAIGKKLSLLEWTLENQESTKSLTRVIKWVLQVFD